jgi:hypothetical protein
MTIDLKYKSDFSRVQEYYRSFWNHEIIDRPLVWVTAPKDNVNKRIPVPYMAGAHDGQYAKTMTIAEEWMAGTYYAGESFPTFEISLGPDQFSAFLGAEISLAKDRATSWVHPFVDDWKSVKIELNNDNKAWRTIFDFYCFAAEFSEGRFLLNMLDLHSNIDCLSAMRGSEKLCMDLVDYPDEVEKVLCKVMDMYAPIFNAVYEAGDMKNRGATGWAPVYCEGKFAVIQCDFICMLGPEHTKRFAIPAIKQEAEFLDHCVFHLDGSAALIHLDEILAIPEIDVIQWVPGAGQPLTLEWTDVIEKIQKAGKGLWVYDCSAEQIKHFHKKLRPEGLLYSLEAASAKEADDLICWLKKNT